jgi:phosphate-selective porin
LEVRYDFTRLNLDFVPSLPFLSPGKTDTQMHTIGVRYYLTDSVDVTAERIAVRNQGQEVWNSFHRVWPVNGNPGGYALTVRYRPTDRSQIAITADKWCTDESDCRGSRGVAAGIPSNAYYSNTYTASYRYRIDQNWAIMAQVMRIEGSNTEITGRPRQDVTNRYGLRISYSW